MAETLSEHNHADFESRLAALEKSIGLLRKQLVSSAAKADEIHADVTAAHDKIGRVALMFEEVLPLVRKAAPLLDSPMAKMATSGPAAAALNLFGGARRGR